MRIAFALAALIGATALAGCTQNIQPTEADRALIGAGAGAVIADLAGENVLAGAGIGAAAGALCNDVQLCQ